MNSRMRTILLTDCISSKNEEAGDGETKILAGKLNVCNQLKIRRLHLKIHLLDRFQELHRCEARMRFEDFVEGGFVFESAQHGDAVEG